MKITSETFSRRDLVSMCMYLKDSKLKPDNSFLFFLITLEIGLLSVLYLVQFAVSPSKKCIHS